MTREAVWGRLETVASVRCLLILASTVAALGGVRKIRHLYDIEQVHRSTLSRAFHDGSVTGTI